ncbi:hypothetical protein [Nonomuraea africana]|uniref:Cell division protein FtsB n=1 Tax=Nonomuraea africana TaxID=46171 RepID=A0ABR9KNT7_9ACTN|nr:hypothetical protein [Nonomuraea africana]MBE1563693.1 cell division protein FtsB [Nonomuraea africana]
MSTQDELRRLEEDLARLKASNADLRSQISDMGATDVVEKSAMLGMADEQDGLIAELESRRDELRSRLS